MVGEVSSQYLGAGRLILGKKKKKKWRCSHFTQYAIICSTNSTSTLPNSFTNHIPKLMPIALCTHRTKYKTTVTLSSESLKLTKYIYSGVRTQTQFYQTVDLFNFAIALFLAPNTANSKIWMLLQQRGILPLIAVDLSITLIQ